MWSKLALLELFTTHTSDVDRRISEEHCILERQAVSVSVEQVRFIGTLYNTYNQSPGK